MAEVQETNGYLDVENATLRSSKIEATSNIGIANTAPQHAFSVGSNLYIDTESSNVLTVDGNVVCEGVKVGLIEIIPSYDFAAVSNVGNVTQSTIQFSNATTGFVTTANVEIGGNISLTSNAQVKVGSNVLAEYTGPHGREPKEMPIKKFPEIVFEEGKFDSNDSTNTYVQAGYTVTASSQANDAKNAATLYDDKFPDINSSLNGWQGLNGTYDPSGDATSIDTLTGITGATSTRDGSYTTIELPHKIKVSRIQLHTRNSIDHSNAGHPKQIYVYGSNDGSSWTQIGSHLFTATPSSPIWQKIDINSTTPYNYFALQATSILDDTGRISLLDLEWYGTEEPAPPGDLSLDTTLKSTFNSVRSNNYVMYFDGEDPAAGNVPKYLPSGSAKSITPNNVVFDATNNCWTLDGSTESNVTTGSLGFEGDAPHTVSTWINASNLDANATTQQLFSIGSGYDKALVRVDDTQIAANTWHNVTYAYQGEGGSKVTYVDGRKVEEAQVEDTFGDYPPFAMTDYETGGYRVSVSSEGGSQTGGDFRRGWHVFDNKTDASGSFPHTVWQTFYANTFSSDGTIHPSNTTKGTFVADGTTYIGEWLKLEMPQRLNIAYVYIASAAYTSLITSRRPRKGAILGSNDNVSWHRLKSFNNDLSWTTVTVAEGGSTTQIVSDYNTDKFYKYFLFVIEESENAGNVDINEIKIYGHKEGDLTRFPEPTRVLKYPHVAMTGPGQRGYVASASSQTSTTVDYPHRIFDGDDTTQFRSAVNTYTSGTANTTDNLKTQTSAGGTATINGSWVSIELPHKLILQSTRVVSNDGTSHVPERLIIYGSNDITNDGWTEVDTTYKSADANIPYAGTGKTWTTTASSTGYKNFALAVSQIESGTGNNRLVVSTWELYGTEEDTGTPAIVGGPFAGKVANFRVYDQYLGDERIQEIYDAQKDAFGHKKSSMTFYKGRIGVGTTEPEGALTVVDEPHALAKFPARAVSSDESYVEGDGQIKLSAADGSGYQAFDGLTSTSWTATPTRNTRVSEEVDFGAWLKIQTPESISLKKAEIESNPYWRQVGTTINDSAEHAASNSSFGMALDCSDDGTRIIVGAYLADVDGTDRGQAFVFEWNGSSWVKLGNTLQGTQNGEILGYAVAISGDGNYIALGSPNYHTATHDDAGRYGVFNLVGATWTILPDAGALTSTTVDETDYFIGAATTARAGWSLSLSHDGKTIAAGYRDLSPGGEIRVHTYTNGVWGLKGQSLLGTESSDRLGQNVKMSPDGNYLIAGAPYGAKSEVYVYDYNSSTSQWVKRTTLTHPTLPNANTHFYGSGIAISDDGNTVAVGASADDTGGADYGKAYIYSWSGSAWTLVSTLTNPLQGTDGESFGTAVDLSGDGTRLVVAAAFENVEQGYAFTFEYNGGSWGLRDYTNIGSGGLPTNNGRLGEFYTGLIISRDGSTIVGGDRAGSANSKARVWNMPSNIKSIWGSNDDTNWTKITTGNETFRVSDRLEFKNLDNPNYYKYHAIVADAFTRLKDVKLFGVRKQGSSTLHDGALTLTKNLDVPRIGPPPDADDTPRRDRLVVEYNTSTNPVEDGLVQDTSGRGFHGAMFGGAYYDATEKALRFDGSGDYTEVQLPSHQVKGDWIHSVSCWVKADVINAEETVWNIGDRTGQASGVQASTSTLSFNSASPTLRWYFYANDGSTNLYTINQSEWNHIVVVYYGGGHNGTNSLVYINGNKVLLNSFTASAALNFDETRDRVLMLGRLPWGTASDLDGSISNFKLYDTALTAQEVKTLYDMGRCDEGGHVVNFSKTRVGIGLGDGEAPRAALDVRGDIYGGMPVFFDARFTSAPTATHVGTRIVFDTLNNSRGGGFDTSTGIFTAPIAGQYKFSYFMRGNIVNKGIKIKPRINGSPSFSGTGDGTDQNLLGTAFCANDGLVGSAVCIVPLEAGGTFELMACTQGDTVSSALATYYNGFTGEYISSL